MNPIKKIVFTGAPSTGKSTTMSTLAPILGNNGIIVPESAVVLLSGGFPAPEHNDMAQIRAFQQAVIPVQMGLEIVFAKQNPSANLMIFDRGILDGASFWPPGPEDYFAEFKVDVPKEYAKYNYVLFFELPREEFFGGINRLRFHNYAQCLESEKKLKKIWGKHPHFIEIKATEDFNEKIQNAISIVQEIEKS
ncbi:MAG: AAA family ATPase [Pseudomonadota bacterium]